MQKSVFSHCLGGRCACKDFIDQNGYGNCRKKHNERLMCYVELPSFCGDLHDSEVTAGEKGSYEACSDPGKYALPLTSLYV